MSEKIAVYPGTFDPMTKGHFDLIVRASTLYDRLIVAVAATSTKAGAMFPGEERLAMIREDVERAGLTNVTVKVLDTLLTSTAAPSDTAAPSGTKERESYSYDVAAFSGKGGKGFHALGDL